jgi:CDP-diacylglycerol--glycerol-3-phosphate 3-phosphatidyltransferase
MSTIEPSKSGRIMNVPNQLTAARIILSIVLFAVIGIAQGTGLDPALKSNLFLAALVLFVVAAGTDWIDGYWARKYDQVTVLGRISDPFADKFIICGSFIFLVASPGSQVTAWMAVIVVGRELLVTALRGFLEQQGTDFSANMPGKLKMVVQCATVVGSLWLLCYTDPESPAPALLGSTVLVLAWGTVLITVYSGVIYIFAAIRLLRQ